MVLRASHKQTQSSPPNGPRGLGWLWRALVASFFLLGPLWLSCGPSGTPVLDTMQPKQGFSGQATKITIFGVEFPDAEVEIRLIGRSTTVTLLNPKRIDATQLEAVLPEDASPGAYDLQVTFADREEKFTLGGAFEVVAQALQIYFIEVGQGDATLLVSPDKKTMLIDAGPPGQAPQIEAVLQRLQIRHLDHVIATHYDADHVGSLEALVNGPDGKPRTGDDHEIRSGLWDPGGFSKNPSYSRVRSRFNGVNKSLDGKSDASFPKIDLGGGVSVQVRTANGVVLAKDGTRRAINCGSDANCRSIGTLITIGKVKIWTAGDLTGGGNGTPDVESELAKSIGRVDVYRSHHHGSKTSSNAALLKALSPQIVIVSAGKDNDYCHPHAGVLERYAALRDIWVFVTSNAVTSPKDCGKTTEARLQSLGGRAVVAAGTFQLTAEPDGFRIKVPAEPEPVRWKAR